MPKGRSQFGLHRTGKVSMQGEERRYLILLGGTLGQTQEENFIMYNSGKQHFTWHITFFSKMCNSTVIRYQNRKAFSKMKILNGFINTVNSHEASRAEL